MIVAVWSTENTFDDECDPFVSHETFVWVQKEYYIVTALLTRISWAQNILNLHLINLYISNSLLATDSIPNQEGLNFWNFKIVSGSNLILWYISGDQCFSILLENILCPFMDILYLTKKLWLLTFRNHRNRKIAITLKMLYGFGQFLFISIVTEAFKIFLVYGEILHINEVTNQIVRSDKILTSQFSRSVFHFLLLHMKRAKFSQCGYTLLFRIRDLQNF